MRRRSTSEPRIHAIVPVNVLSRSKRRLSPLLDRLGREQLTLLMLRHVLRTLKRSKAMGEVTIVSADSKIPPIADRYKVRFLRERPRHGLNNALRLALKNVQERGDSRVLIIHADLPLLTKGDIDNLVSEASECELAIVPSKDGHGTNALLMMHPNVIPPSFGRESYNRHMSQARKRAVKCKVVRSEGIRFDIDEIKDLHELGRQRAPSETQQFLKKLGIG